MSGEYLWTVDNYCDAVRRRRAGVARDTFMGRPRFENVFETEELAIAFIFGRADKRISDAENELKKARQRRKNVSKRFGAGAKPGDE